MSKILQTRVQNKHDIKANWDKATNFIPLAGEIIIYDDLNRIKIGDGESYLKDIKYIDETCVQFINELTNKMTNLETALANKQDKIYTWGDLANIADTSLVNVAEEGA